ncbi:MAG: arginase family protein, partial [Hyphomicrobiales bacterium]
MTLSSNIRQKDSSRCEEAPSIGPLLERIQAEPREKLFNEGMFQTPVTNNLSNVDIVCVGVPFDQSKSFDLSGPRQGPHAVRHASAGQGEIHGATGINVFKACSVVHWGDATLHGRRGQIGADITAISNVYKKFALAGVTPLSLGGEAISTYGMLKGLSLGGERPVAFIHLDAHHRSNGDRFGPRLTNRGFLRLATVKGLIDPEKSAQIGVRAQGLTGLEFAKQTGMTVISAREFQSRRPRDVAEEVRNTIGDMPCYLSVDASIFDCGILPSAKAPVPFGLAVREVRDFLDGLCGMNLVGADLMELTPHYDTACISAAIGSSIAFEMLGLLASGSIARKNGMFDPGVSPRIANIQQ